MKPELATKLLKGAGFTDELLKKAEEADFKPEDAIEAVNNSQKEHYEQLLKNDLTEAITGEVTKKLDGEFFGKLNANLKKSGMPIEEIQELSMADKIIKFEKFLKEKYEKNVDKDKLKEQFQELEKKNLELTNKLTEKDEEVIKTVEQVKKDSQSQLIKDKVELRLQKEYNNIPDNRLVGGKKTDGLFIAAKSMADTKYDLGLDEKTNEVIFYEKGTQKRAVAKKDGKENFVTASDVIQNELKGLSLWVESNGQGQQQKQTTTTTQTDTTKPTSSRLQQMKEAAGV